MYIYIYAPRSIILFNFINQENMTLHVRRQTWR